MVVSILRCVCCSTAFLTTKRETETFPLLSPPPGWRTPHHSLPENNSHPQTMEQVRPRRKPTRKGVGVSGCAEGLTGNELGRKTLTSSECGSKLGRLLCVWGRWDVGCVQWSFWLEQSVSEEFLGYSRMYMCVLNNRTTVQQHKNTEFSGGNFSNTTICYYWGNIGAQQCSSGLIVFPKCVFSLFWG